MAKAFLAKDSMDKLMQLMSKIPAKHINHQHTAQKLLKLIASTTSVLLHAFLQSHQIWYLASFNIVTENNKKKSCH